MELHEALGLVKQGLALMPLEALLALEGKLEVELSTVRTLIVIQRLALERPNLLGDVVAVVEEAPTPQVKKIRKSEAKPPDPPEVKVQLVEFDRERKQEVGRATRSSQVEDAKNLCVKLLTHYGRMEWTQLKLRCRPRGFSYQKVREALKGLEFEEEYPGMYRLRQPSLEKERSVG